MLPPLAPVLGGMILMKLLSTLLASTAQQRWSARYIHVWRGGIPIATKGRNYAQNYLYISMFYDSTDTTIDSHMYIWSPADPSVHAAMRIKSVKSHVHMQELNLSLVMDIGNAQTHIWESQACLCFVSSTVSIPVSNDQVVLVCSCNHFQDPELKP